MILPIRRRSAPVQAHSASVRWLRFTLAPSPAANSNDAGLFSPGGPSADEVHQDKMGACYYPAPPALSRAAEADSDAHAMNFSARMTSK